MAAGDLIIPDNTITPEILDQITAEVQNRLSQSAKDPADWEEINTLTGVSSLPVFQQSGNVYKLVRVALSILQGVDGDDGKTPVIEIGTVTEGETASATLTSNGVDASGNPRYKLNLVMPEGTPGTPGTPGTDGKTPKFETGVVTTLNPGEQASASITFKEYDTDGSPIYTVGLSLPKGDKGDTGKTVKMGTVTVTSGETPSGTFSQNGEDSAGNPIYDLALTVQKGDNGKNPVFEQGTTTTLDPSADAYVEVVPNGVTEEGNPRYTLNFGVPRGVQGAAGTGSGNVYVPGTGLQSGKTYLFKPDTDGSTTGTFVEYTAPEIPEQVQPDWNATEGKGVILNKPTIPTKTSQLQNDSDFKNGTQIATILLDYVQKIEGKGLSTEDFTTALKQKLEGLTNYNDTSLQSKVTSLQNQLNTLLNGDSSSAIDTFNEIVQFLSGVEDTETLDGI